MLRRQKDIVHNIEAVIFIVLMQDSTFASATEGSCEINHRDYNHNLRYRAVHTLPKRSRNDSVCVCVYPPIQLQ